MENKTKLEVSQALWEFINEYNELPFKAWPDEFQREFGGIKLIYGIKRIILSKIGKKDSWKLDTSKVVDNLKYYRFKNPIIETIFSDKNLVKFDEKYRLPKRSTKELNNVLTKIINFIKENKDGVSYTDISKFIIEKIDKETYTSSARHNSSPVVFLKDLLKNGIINNNNKYYYTENIKESIDMSKCTLDVIKEMTQKIKDATTASFIKINEKHYTYSNDECNTIYNNVRNAVDEFVKKDPSDEDAYETLLNSLSDRFKIGSTGGDISRQVDNLSTAEYLYANQVEFQEMLDNAKDVVSFIQDKTGKIDGTAIKTADANKVNDEDIKPEEKIEDKV